MDELSFRSKFLWCQTHIYSLNDFHEENAMAFIIKKVVIEVLVAAILHNHWLSAKSDLGYLSYLSHWIFLLW